MKYILLTVAVFLFAGTASAKGDKPQEGQWGDCVQTACGAGAGTQTCVAKEKRVLDFLFVKDKCKVGDTQECTMETVEACPIIPVKEDNNCNDPVLHYSQGPNGIKGDSIAQLEWRKIKDSSRVEIKIAYDGVFGNGAKKFKTDNDGAKTLHLTGNAWVKFRGTGGDCQEWSKAIHVKP